MMKAQMLAAPGRLEYMDIPVPQCKDNEVLIKINRACICNGSDPSIYQGNHWNNYPVVFGHEASGEIISCGIDVKNYNTGDRVSWWFTMGAFAEYICVCPAAVAMVKLPDFIDEDDCPIFELVGASVRAVETAEMKKGAQVLIIGLGPSGLIMSQWARNLGASRVVGWDLYGLRRETGRKLGCTQVFDSRQDNIVESTRTAVGEVDVIIDAYGNDELEDMGTLTRGIGVLKQGGKIISYGHPVKGRMLDNYSLQSKGITIQGPVNDLTLIRKYYDKAVQYYREGSLNIKPMITGRVSLTEVEKGLDMVTKYPDKNIKILVEI
jgi:L-iditol 2-dehydrogenase